MKRCIVYGVGRRYKYLKAFIESEFDIIAYADKDPKADESKKIISPSQISQYEYDCVYITSNKYAQEIRDELQKIYAVPESKILTEKDMWFYIPNADVRHAWIKKQLSEIPSGKIILDAGAGNRRYQKYCAHLNYVSQDFGKYDDVDINTAVGIIGSDAWKSKQCNIVSDIVDIPVSDNSFDVVMCTEVFEHIKDPVLALKEFSRILKFGGGLLLTAPFCSPTHMAPYYFSNGFSRYWYEEHLKDFGFEIQEIKSFGNYFSYVAQELERMQSMTERYATEVDADTQRNLVFLTKKLLGLSAIGDKSADTLCFGFLVKAIKK